LYFAKGMVNLRTSRFGSGFSLGGSEWRLNQPLLSDEPCLAVELRQAGDLPAIELAMGRKCIDHGDTSLLTPLRSASWSAREMTGAPSGRP